MLYVSIVEKESGTCGRGFWLLVKAMGHQSVLSGRCSTGLRFMPLSRQTVLIGKMVQHGAFSRNGGESTTHEWYLPECGSFQKVQSTSGKEESA